MRIKILSDIHINPVSMNGGYNYIDHGEDVCVLAGDIGEGMTGIIWAYHNIPAHIKVVYVPGNHEYYGEDIVYLNQKMREHPYGYNIHVLNNDTYSIGGITFAGSTLWTDFKLYDNPLSAVLWKQGLNDSVYIRNNGGKLTSDAVEDMNRKSLQFLDKVDADILVTHYCPSTSDITRWRGHALTPGFATRIPEHIHNKFKYHIHGHTHDSLRYKVPGGPEVICNPKGYSNAYGSENSGFQDDLIIEI